MRKSHDCNYFKYTKTIILMNGELIFLSTGIYYGYTFRKEDMGMQAQVKEWGNSQGIRLSKEVLKSAGIELNEILDVSVANGVITLMKPFHHKTLEERAAEYDGKLMLDGEYDWGDPIGREIW